MEKILEIIKIEPAVLNSDITTARESTFRSAKDYRQFVAHLQTGTVAQTKVATVELLQATDASGTGKKRLGSLTTYTAPTGGGTANITAEARQDQMDSANGFTFIAVKVTSDNATAVLGGATLTLAKPVYNQK